MNVSGGWPILGLESLIGQLSDLERYERCDILVGTNYIGNDNNWYDNSSTRFGIARVAMISFITLAARACNYVRSL